MYRIDVFEKAVKQCGYKLKYVKYDDKRYILFAEGFVSKLPYKVRWDSMGNCSKQDGRCRLPEYDLPLASVFAKESLEFLNKFDSQIPFYTKQVIEKAAEMCGYEVYVYGITRKSIKIEGFVPGLEGKLYWNTYGFCYRYRDNKRLFKYDLPIQSAREQLELEEFNYVCR